MIWLKTLSITPQTKQVIDYLDKLTADLENQKVVENNEKKVFISYNHKDEDIVKKLQQKLEENNIKVILDTVSMKAGTPIEEFISESIRTSQATISIVSNNSLLSGWVAMETVNILNFQKLFKDQKYVPCCINDDFTKDHFVGDAVTKFDDRLNEISALILQHDKDSIDSRDLNDEKSRINFLRSNIDGIVGNLKKTLYINIGGDGLEKNFVKVLEAI